MAHSKKAHGYLQEAYSELCQISKMELLAKTVNNFQQLTTVAKTPFKMFGRAQNTLLSIVNVLLLLLSLDEIVNYTKANINKQDQKKAKQMYIKWENLHFLQHFSEVKSRL